MLTFSPDFVFMFEKKVCLSITFPLSLSLFSLLMDQTSCPDTSTGRRGDPPEDGNILRTWRKSAKTRLLQVLVWALWVRAFRVPRLMRTDGGAFVVSLPSGIRNTQEGTFSRRLPKYSPNSHSSLLEMNSNLLRKINLVLLWKQAPHCPMTLPGEIKVLFKN